MITVEQVKAAKWSALFLDASDHWVQSRKCIDFPRLAMTDQGPRGPRSKVPRSRTFFVDGRPFLTLDEALAALNQPEPAEAP